MATMGKLADSFKIRLNEALEAWGARAELVQKSGISGPTIDLWRKGTRVPDLDQLEQVAAALEMQPLDLIGPELPSLNAVSTRASDTSTEIAAGVEASTANKPQPGKDALIGQIVARLSALDEAQLKHLLAIVKALPLTGGHGSPQRAQERKQKG